MADTLIKTLQNKEYSELKDNVEKVIAKKVVARVTSKHNDVLSKLNGIAVDVFKDSTNED